jgi:hypothetical protein
MTTDEFKLTSQYQKTTRAYMGLINRASNSVADSQAIARTMYAYCTHQDEGKLSKAMRPLPAKYPKREHRPQDAAAQNTPARVGPSCQSASMSVWRK